MKFLKNEKFPSQRKTLQEVSAIHDNEEGNPKTLSTKGRSSAQKNI